MSKTRGITNGEACARQRPLPAADACGVSRDIWATAQMWETQLKTRVGGVPCVSMQLGQKTNHIYLSNPSPAASTHRNKHTHTYTHTGWKFGPPAEETCLTQSCKCLFPPLLWNDSVSIGGFEGAKPCLEDNLVRTIWSRFHYSFLWFFFCLLKGIKHFFFSLDSQQKCHVNIIYLFEQRNAHASDGSSRGTQSQLWTV